VHVEKRDVGGVIKIDFFSYDDLETIAAQIQKANISIEQKGKLAQKLENAMKSLVGDGKKQISEVKAEDVEKVNNEIAGLEGENNSSDILVDDRGKNEARADEESEDDKLYDIKNFTI
jgi:hypothetical protein